MKLKEKEEFDELYVLLKNIMNYKEKALSQKMVSKIIKLKKYFNLGEANFSWRDITEMFKCCEKSIQKTKNKNFISEEEKFDYICKIIKNFYEEVFNDKHENIIDGNKVAVLMDETHNSSFYYWGIRIYPELKDGFLKKIEELNKKNEMPYKISYRSLFNSFIKQFINGGLFLQIEGDEIYLCNDKIEICNIETSDKNES